MNCNFERYMASLDGMPFEVEVDLSLHDRAPIAGLEYRLHIRLELNHPSADGLSSKEEDALLAAVEEEILDTLPAEDYVLAARVTHRSARTLVVFARKPPEEGDAVHQALDRFDTHRTRVQHANDPEWTEYLEVLYPSQELLHQIHDRRVLKEFERRGDDCSALHVIEPRFVGLSKAQAEALAEGLRARGFGVKTIEESAGADGKGWSVTGEARTPLGLAILDDFRHAWIELAGAHGGSYKGWSAELVPVSGKNYNHGCSGHLDGVPELSDVEESRPAR